MERKRYVWQLLRGLLVAEVGDLTLAVRHAGRVVSTGHAVAYGT